MPYCTRCGKPIQEGERCSCTKKNGLNFKFSSDSTAGSLSFGSAGRNPDVQYERGQKIVPDNIAPNESEIPVRQYNLCVMRSRIKGARAEGRLQLTNKRILFRAKGTAPVGETTIQHEFSIDEVAGFQIVRNFRFSILDLLLIFALSVAIGYIGVGFGGFLGRTLKAFGSCCGCACVCMDAAGTVCWQMCFPVRQCRFVYCVKRNDLFQEQLSDCS